MTAETSNARGEWVLVPRVPTEAMISHGEEWEYSTISNGPAMARQLYAAMLAAAPSPAATPQQSAARGVVDGCHCATCTCNPWMTPAIRFDTSPAAQEGAIRDHLIALGWTPPGAQQTAAEEQGGGSAELRRMVAKLAAHVRPTCGELWAEAESLLNSTAPPSAPVGVEDIAMELERYADCPGSVLALAGKLRALATQQQGGVE